jgi:Zn finger protein HypA/HybF involved in hydrogenase expression
VNRSSGTNCPKCKYLRVKKGNNLAVLRPELAKQWDLDHNGGLTPYEVSPGSNRKVAWICEKGHQWKAIINNRSNGNNCPKCRISRK